MLTVGMTISEFNLEGLDPDGQSRSYSIQDLLLPNKYLVLYAYPRDNTPGCTTEACDFRDNLNRLTTWAQVAGISPDSVESHRKFKTKHGLTFPLLSDPEHTVLAAMGAWGEKILYGEKSLGVIRTTLLIDPQGVIVKVWPKVKVAGHVEAVIAELKTRA